MSRKLKFALIGALAIFLSGCDETVSTVIDTSASSSGKYEALLTQTSYGGAWDGFVFDVHIRYKEQRVWAALLTQPSLVDGRPNIKLHWNGDEKLIVQFDVAGRAEVSKKKIRLGGTAIQVELEGRIDPSFNHQQSTD